MQGLPYAVVLTLVPIDGRLEAVDMAVIAVPGGPPVTRTGLAQIPVTEMVQSAAEAFTVSGGPTSYSFPAGIDDEQIERLRRGKPGPAELQTIAHAYRITRAVSPNPIATLADELAINRANITRWVTRAVDEGYLAPEERDLGTPAVPAEVRSAAQVEALLDAYVDGREEDR